MCRNPLKRKYTYKLLGKMKLTILLATVLLAMTSYGQNNFEKGYILDKNNQQIECLIKNTSLIDNPESILYKLSADGSEVSASPGSINEFQITGYSKYISAD